MIELDVENGSISFKRPLSLSDFSKAMTHFNKMYKLMFGVNASYKDFTDFLSTCKDVTLTPGIKEKKL